MDATDFIPKVERVARILRAKLPRNVEAEDLIQDGLLAVLRALPRYDPSRSKPNTFFDPRIRGGIIDGLRQRDWINDYARRKSRNRHNLPDMVEMSVLSDRLIERGRKVA